MYLKLIHPRLGEVTRRQVASGHTKNSLTKLWKSRYGKKFDECTIEVEGKSEFITLSKNIPSYRRKLANIQTGDIYPNQKAAAKAMGISEQHVRNQLQRAYKVGYEYTIKYAD